MKKKIKKIHNFQTWIILGIDISGSWEEVAEHAGAKDQSKITFNQRDQKITGLKTIIKTWRETNKIDTKVLIVNGHFQDGHILLTMYNQDRKIQSLSTSLLRIAKGGSALVGN